MLVSLSLSPVAHKGPRRAQRRARTHPSRHGKAVRAVAAVCIVSHVSTR
jgi:hypothetical protein